VEVGVQVVERWAAQRDPLAQSVFGLGELNQAMRELSEELNDRIMRHLGKSRRELFEALDRPVLKSLPAEPYQLATPRQAQGSSGRRPRSASTTMWSSTSTITASPTSSWARKYSSGRPSAPSVFDTQGVSVVSWSPGVTSYGLQADAMFGDIDTTIPQCSSFDGMFSEFCPYMTTLVPYSYSLVPVFYQPHEHRLAHHMAFFKDEGGGADQQGAHLVFIVEKQLILYPAS